MRITAWLPRLNWQGSRGNRQSVTGIEPVGLWAPVSHRPLNLAPKKIRG